MSYNCSRRGEYGDSSEETANLFSAAPTRNSWQVGPLNLDSAGGSSNCNIATAGIAEVAGAGQGAITFQGFLGGRGGGSLYGGIQPSSTAGVHARWDLNPVQVGENETTTQRDDQDKAAKWILANTSLRGPDEDLLAGYSVDQRLGQQNVSKAPCLIYKECQKNQSLDSATHCIDGCGEFMRRGRDGQEALQCMACGCHRSYHRSVRVGDDGKEENEPEEEPRISDLHESLSRIETVALNLMEATGRAMPLLAADPIRGVDDLAQKELDTVMKISIENLDHISKVTLSTVECIGILQTAASSTQRISASSRQYQRLQNQLDLSAPSDPLFRGNPDQGRLSSEVSPVSTTDRRMHQLSPSLQLNSKQQAQGQRRVQNAVTPGKPKRKRTQFTDEQRGKMKAYAEHAGWTIVGQRKENIAEACKDIGVTPKTLKYWIHNAKQKLKRFNDQLV